MLGFGQPVVGSGVRFGVGRMMIVGGFGGAAVTVEVIGWTLIAFCGLFLMGWVLRFETKTFLEMKAEYKATLADKTLSEPARVEWLLFYRYYCNMMFFFYSADDLDKY